MQIGPLRERLTLQVATTVQDAEGHPVETWVDVASNPTVWGAVTSSPRGERYISGGEQVVALIQRVVKVRFREDATVQMRWVWRDKYLYIENIHDPDGRRAMLLMTCNEEQF